MPIENKLHYTMLRLFHSVCDESCHVSVLNVLDNQKRKGLNKATCT